jgi:hypothetical protein
VEIKRKFLFDDIVKNTFLESVRRTGLVTKSAKSVGTNMRRVRAECDVDKDFEFEFQDALTEYAESVQAELHRRAVVGVEEDVYFQGTVCGSKTNYSDALLTTLVKAKSPEFREKLSVDTTIHGGVLLTLPQAPNPTAWIEAANAPEQLPAHEEEPEEANIIDVEVEEA